MLINSSLLKNLLSQKRIPSIVTSLHKTPLSSAIYHQPHPLKPQGTPVRTCNNSIATPTLQLNFPPTSNAVTPFPVAHRNKFRSMTSSVAEESIKTINPDLNVFTRTDNRSFGNIEHAFARSVGDTNATISPRPP